MTDYYSFTERVAELSRFRKGWFDGEGELIAKSALVVTTIIKRFCVRHMFDLPSIYPTPEGGVQLEWDEPEITATIDPDGSVLWTGSVNSSMAFTDVYDENLLNLLEKKIYV